MSSSTLCFIGLGSNLEQPRQQLDSALQALRANSEITDLTVSSYYTTAAIGPGQQPDYQNAVARFATPLAAIQLLDLLQSIENQQGRVRELRWGARTLDLDLLLYGEATLNCERLTVPHPRIYERQFVLEPLAELAPELHFPDGSSVAQRLAKLL